MLVTHNAVCKMRRCTDKRASACCLSCGYFRYGKGPTLVQFCSTLVLNKGCLPALACACCCDQRRRATPAFSHVPGTLCGVTANVALGPEAPMVHLGGCVAHVATHAACSAPCPWTCMLRTPCCATRMQALSQHARCVAPCYGMAAGLTRMCTPSACLIISPKITGALDMISLGRVRVG